GTRIDHDGSPAGKNREEVDLRVPLTRRELVRIPASARVPTFRTGNEGSRARVEGAEREGWSVNPSTEGIEGSIRSVDGICLVATVQLPGFDAELRRKVTHAHVGERGKTESISRCFGLQVNEGPVAPDIVLSSIIEGRMDRFYVLPITEQAVSSRVGGNANLDITGGNHGKVLILFIGVFDDAVRGRNDQVLANVAPRAGDTPFELSRRLLLVVQFRNEKTQSRRRFRGTRLDS